MSYYRQQLYNALAQEWIAPNASVLSIGGDQNDQQYFRDRKGEGSQWSLLDNNPANRPTIEHDMNRPLVGASSMTFEEAESFVEAFDVVLALELWEYIYNPVVAHENIATLLKTGGTYYGSYPFVYPTHRPVAIDMLRYTEAAIRKYLALQQLDVIWITPRISLSTTLWSFYSAEGMKLAPIDELQPAQRSFGQHEVVGWVVKARKL